MGNFKMSRQINVLDRDVVKSTQFGDVYFVDYANGADTNDGKSSGKAFKTLSAAYAAATTNNNDIIYVDGHSTVVETAMITWAKNRITVIGVGSHGRMIQQSAKIQLGVTTAATDLAPVMVTGVRNSFFGIKSINANTKAESLYGWIENGEGSYYENFMSVVTGNLSRANHAHFWLSGDAASGRNLTFGHSTLQSTETGFGILIDGKAGGGSGGVVKECFFEDVRVNMSVDNAKVDTSCFIKIADNSALNFGNAIDRFRGYNFAPPGEAQMTDAVLAAASTTAGELFLTDPAFFGCAGVGAGAGYGVYIANSGGAADADGGLGTELTD